MRRSSQEEPEDGQLRSTSEKRKYRILFFCFILIIFFQHILTYSRDLTILSVKPFLEVENQFSPNSQASQHFFQEENALRYILQIFNLSVRQR